MIRTTGDDVSTKELRTDDRNETRTAVAALCYLPPLFVIPYLLPRSGSGERFHARQGIVLFAGLLVLAVGVLLSDLILGRLLGGLVLIGGYFVLVARLIHYPIALAVVVLYIALSTSAAIQAAAGRTWSIPIVADYAARLPFGR